MHIDVHEVTEGVSAANSRFAKRIGHVEKTSVQKPEVTVKNSGPMTMGCKTARASRKN